LPLGLSDSNSIECIQPQQYSVTGGVSQGLIVGLLLFLYYVNVIMDVSNFPSTLFSDDTVLALSGKSVFDLKTRLTTN